SWLAGLASHWQWAYAMGVPLGVVALTQRRWSVVVPMAFIFATWVAQAPSAPKANAGVSARSIITVASANLNFATKQHQGLQKWLESPQAPDVVVLLEFTSSAHAAVTSASVKAKYPHQLLAPTEDQFGMGLLSRHPVESSQWIRPRSHMDTLKLRAVVNVKGTDLAITAVHPMPPISADYAQNRDRSLDEEGAMLAQ